MSPIRKSGLRTFFRSLRESKIITTSTSITEVAVTSTRTLKGKISRCPRHQRVAIEMSLLIFSKYRGYSYTGAKLLIKMTLHKRSSGTSTSSPSWLIYYSRPNSKPNSNTTARRTKMIQVNCLVLGVNNEKQ